MIHASRLLSFLSLLIVVLAKALPVLFLRDQSSTSCAIRIFRVCCIDNSSAIFLLKVYPSDERKLHNLTAENRCLYASYYSFPMNLNSSTKVSQSWRVSQYCFTCFSSYLYLCPPDIRLLLRFPMLSYHQVSCCYDRLSSVILS